MLEIVVCPTNDTPIVVNLEDILAWGDKKPDGGGFLYVQELGEHKTFLVPEKSWEKIDNLLNKYQELMNAFYQQTGVA